MSQNLLECFEIDAVRQHQCRSSVPQLMRGELRRIHPGLQQVLFDQPMDGGHADAVFVAGAKQRPIVRKHDFVAFDEVFVNGLTAGGAHIDDPLLVALADNANAVVIHVRQIQSDQLRTTDAAVEKEHQNGKVTLLIGA